MNAMQPESLHSLLCMISYEVFFFFFNRDIRLSQENHQEQISFSDRQVYIDIYIYVCMYINNNGSTKVKPRLSIHNAERGVSWFRRSLSQTILLYLSWVGQGYTHIHTNTSKDLAG